MPAPFDPAHCPLCGQDNACGAVAGSAECWCFRTKFPPELLSTVPSDARGVACVCRACAESSTASPQDPLPDTAQE